MEDRVGDILAQRAKLDSGAGVALFFSVLFHAALTAIAAWSAWHHVSTAATPVMMIRFAQPQATPELTPAAPAAAPPQPIAAAQPKPKPNRCRIPIPAAARARGRAPGFSARDRLKLDDRQLDPERA